MAAIFCDAGPSQEEKNEKDIVAARFVLDCGSYQIEVAQDLGVGRQSLGAYVHIEGKK